ncbi:MAG: N-acetylmuramoyl-L-alanine amidase, partial [Puniceicoccales bacterium]|nr:N-acetylmuramoyl-L-alanine amidase [Puniceicoccales bacterium]
QDVEVPIASRAPLAKRYQADLFVSIHFNSASGATANGIETFVLAPQWQYSTNDAKHLAKDAELRAREIGHQNDPWNVLLGYYLHAGLVTKLGAEDRGLRRARFNVLRDAPCPAVLVECGFLNNPAESMRINTPAHREKIAQGIAEGIVRYQQILEHIAPPLKPATTAKR